jgi:predicted permease
MTFSYWTLLSAVAPVFAMIIAGFTLRRTRWLTAEADASLLRVNINLLYPCLIVDSMLGNPALEKISNVTLAPVIGFLTACAGYALAFGVARPLGLNEKAARTFAFTTGLYNYGYIPIPLVQFAYDRDTLGVLFTHNLGVEISLWTAGVMLLTGASPRQNWRNVFNAPVIAILASVLLNLVGGHTWLPQFSLTTAHLLGQSSVPLALLLTGAVLADQLSSADPRGGMRAGIAACALRLGLLPVLFLLVAKYLPCSLELKRVITVQAAMPAAMIPIVLTRHYGGDERVALTVVLTTTIVGLLTIPFWMRIGLTCIGA